MSILSKYLDECSAASALVYFDYGLNISIYIFRNNISEPYFCILDNTNIFNATKCSRISILNPYYIITEDIDNWFLDIQLLEKLQNMFNTNNHFGLTVLESIISDYFSEQYNLFLSKEQLPRLKLLDYTKLSKDTILEV